MNPDQMKEDIANEMKRVKSALYKEELKSALFAVAFSANIAVAICNPFSFITVLNIVISLYILGFFKPTIKRQIKLHEIMAGLKAMLERATNPPEPEKPKTPWSTK